MRARRVGRWLMLIGAVLLGVQVWAVIERGGGGRPGLAGYLGLFLLTVGFIQWIAGVSDGPWKD